MMETEILYGGGKKMRFGYLNGKYSESVLMASYNRNKREADDFSVFGYRRWEIENMLKECFNPLLKAKLQAHLTNMQAFSQKSADQNKMILQKLEGFKKDACGIGLRKVIKRMERLSKIYKDPEIKLTLLLLETEYANLSAKEHKGWLKKKIYQRKNILMYQLAEKLKKSGWDYGINDETGKMPTILSTYICPMEYS